MAPKRETSLFWPLFFLWSLVVLPASVLLVCHTLDGIWTDGIGAADRVLRQSPQHEDFRAVDVRMDGQLATLIGTVPSEEARREAERLVATQVRASFLPQLAFLGEHNPIAKVTNELIVLRPLPRSWVALARRGRAVTLLGEISSQSASDALAQAAQQAFRDHVVTNAIVLASPDAIELPSADGLRLTCKALDHLAAELTSTVSTADPASPPAPVFAVARVGSSWASLDLSGSAEPAALKQRLSTALDGDSARVERCWPELQRVLAQSPVPATSSSLLPLPPEPSLPLLPTSPPRP